MKFPLIILIPLLNSTTFKKMEGLLQKIKEKTGII